MTSRERGLNALDHKPTDKVPFSLGFGINRPVVVELTRSLGFQTLEQTYDYLNSLSDFRAVGPRYIGPAERGRTDEKGVITDQWGVKRFPKAYRDDDCYHEICVHPLAGMEDAAELEAYTWPSTDWYDFSVIPGQIAAHNRNGNEYAITIGIGNIFETAWYMRGLDQMLMDMLINPELARAIMTKVTDFYTEYFAKALSITNGGGPAPIPIDIVFTADDIGAQEGLMISPDLWEKMIKPHHKRLNSVLHGFGVKVMYHTDGAVMEALDGLCDMGVDILEALQFDAKGMSPEIMKRDYGDRLCFHGGISVQSTLPFGSPEDVRNEIEERIAVLGQNGGYILAPSHAVQAGTPVENVKVLLGYGNHCQQV